MGRERTELPIVDTWRHLGQGRVCLGVADEEENMWERQCLQKEWPHSSKRGAWESPS